MRKPVPVFKHWAPEWLIRITIFLVILPCLLLFGLSTANATAAAGFYGIEPADVQYSMILFYAAVASFFALERRFFIYLASKEYFIVGIALQVLTSYVCYRTRSLPVLFLFRFIQGMANCGTTSICITLIFSRLENERSREIGYSVFYGMLLCITPISILLTAPVVDNFDYNFLYKGIMFCYVPGAVLLLMIMNSVRLNRKIPLYQVDWPSFVLYALLLALIGYVLSYGQQYYWLQDQRIRWSCIAIFFLFLLHIYRQLKLKRPSQNLEVFRYRNYVLGMFLIFVLYIARGALTMTSLYFANVLGMDPFHIAYLMLSNIIGIGLSVLISSRLLILKRPLRLIWIYGFLLLLIFHVWMVFLFNAQADASSFVLPLVVQGLGAGMLMTPIIVFAISAVPDRLGGTASAVGVFFRFIGFCSSIALINFYQLYNRSNHINRFQEQLSTLNTIAVDRMEFYRKMLGTKGLPSDQATKIAKGLLNRSVEVQAQMKSAVDYYTFVSYLLIGVILIIALTPYISRTIVNLKSRQPSPISY